MSMKNYITYQQLKNKLTHIPNKEHQGFLCLTYASIGRIGEVVRHKLDKHNTPEHTWQNPPIKAEDIRLRTTLKGNKIITIQVFTEKIRKARTVILNPKKEQWLIKPFFEKKKTIQKGYMYDYSTRWGEKVFEKYFNTQDVHSLRHWRQTHLLNGEVTGKPEHPNIVARMSGHTTLATQRTYDHTVIFDFADNFVSES